jgi:hypothetical protein
MIMEPTRLDQSSHDIVEKCLSLPAFLIVRRKISG